MKIKKPSIHTHICSFYLRSQCNKKKRKKNFEDWKKAKLSFLSPNVMILLLLFSCSAVSNSSTPWTTASQASLSFAISRSLLKLHWVMMPSNHLILCRPFLLMTSTFPSIRVFSSESALCIR